MSREAKDSQVGSDLWWDLRRGPRPGPAGRPSPWRGSGRQQGQDPWRQQARAPQPQPMGDLVTSIDVANLSRVGTHPKINDCEYLASYNWAEDKVPTILVPGCPPVWCPPINPQKLRPDSGEYFRDPNAARSPIYPTMPAMLALFAMQPDFDTSLIDVVACGNTMGGLLSFANLTERTFRFGVEMIGNTVFFVRKENSPMELIPGVYGYGHTFPESYTTWDAAVKGSASHQRLVKYQFGGFGFRVRFESDGYLKDKIKPEEQQHSASATPLSKASDSDMPSLLQGTNSLTVAQKVQVEQNDVKVERKGQKTPQSAVFDLKTRSARNEIDMNEVLPRVWVTQTPNFIIGYHKSGYFDDVRVQDVSGKVREWEAENGELLGRLQSTIRSIIDVAKSSAGQRLEVCRVGSGQLQIRKHVDAEWSALPPHLKDAWTRRPEDKQNAIASAFSLKNDIGAPARVAQKEDRPSTNQDARELALRDESYHRSDDDSLGHDRGLEADGEYEEEESEKDFTACSAHDCGYCGHCDY